ncbi:hypothetical protein BDW60DRAFT_192509 [Aspergillus nidulans var. acristatus]
MHNHAASSFGDSFQGVCSKNSTCRRQTGLQSQIALPILKSRQHFGVMFHLMSPSRHQQSRLGFPWLDPAYGVRRKCGEVKLKRSILFLFIILLFHFEICSFDLIRFQPQPPSPQEIVDLSEP